MKSSVQGKVLEPTVDQITAALRLCAVEEPSKTYPCEQRYLYPYSKDGRMSTCRTCFEHLVLDTCQLINRLNDFQNSQCAKLLARITALEAQLAEAAHE